MPTILRLGGWRVVIYPSDHVPVQVVGPGWVVVNLIGMDACEVIHADERAADEVLRQLEAHQDALLSEWRRFHG